jgi:hypothetical protein
LQNCVLQYPNDAIDGGGGGTNSTRSLRSPVPEEKDDEEKGTKPNKMEERLTDKDFSIQLYRTP